MIQEGTFSILHQISFWFTPSDDDSTLPGDSIAKLSYAAMNQFDLTGESLLLRMSANYHCEPCARFS